MSLCPDVWDRDRGAGGGHAILKMKTNETMNNLFGTTHGAAIYSLLDAAFELTNRSMAQWQWH